VLLLLVVLAVELGGIWVELRHIRSEQVKNKFSGLSDQQLAGFAEIPDAEKALSEL